MYSYGPPHMAKQNDQLELTYSSYVKTQDVTLKICRRQWMIGRSGERWSGISVLAVRHDDNIVVIKFTLQSCYCIHFWTNALGKAMNSHYPHSCGINSTTTVFLQRWFLHWITHKDWYAIKQRNQTKSIFK